MLILGYLGSNMQEVYMVYYLTRVSIIGWYMLELENFTT